MIRFFATKLILPFLLGMAAWCYGQPPAVKLLGFQSSACDEEADISKLQDRIVGQALRGDIYQVTIGTVANCGGIHDAQATMRGDTLKISYGQGSLVTRTNDEGKPYEELLYMLCECCFEFTFTVQGVRRLPPVVTVNDSLMKYYPDKYKVYPVRFQLYEGDTINLRDRDGLRQGYWYEERPHKGHYSGYFKSEKVISINWQENYSPGKPRFVSIRSDTVHGFSAHYYENGSLKSTYLWADQYEEERSFYPDGRLEKIKANDLQRTYYPNGALRSEKPYRSPHHVREQFFYDDGSRMAIHYVKPQKNRHGKKPRNGPGQAAGKTAKEQATGSKSRWKCYDWKGRRVSREFLLKAGYTQLKD